MSEEFGAPERLHPLALVSGLGKAARNLVGAIAAGGYFAMQGNGWIGLLMLGGIAIGTLVSLLLKWWRFSFRLGKDAIRIDSGLLNRNHRTIPFDRVADVSIAQGPLQRILGVATVTLETGGSAAGQEEGLLGGVRLTRAEALRTLVRGRRGLAVPAEASSEEQVPVEAPLFAMDPKRVLTCGLFNFSLALFAGLFGASQTVGDLLDIDPFERKFWRPLLVDSDLGAWLLDHRLGLAMAGVAVLIVAGVVTGLVRTTLREWDYRLDRTGNGFRRRRGLLTRTDVSLPLRRIQAGLITTGPIRDHYGWRALKVESLASDTSAGAGGGNHVLAPLARDAELGPIVDEMGWALPSAATAWRPVSKAHVTSFCVALLPVFPLLLLLAPLRWLEWRRTAWALNGDRLLIRTGWWRRRTLLLPLKNIQTVDLAETSLSRRFGIATLRLGVAGGRIGGHHLPSLARKEASQLRRMLLQAAK